MNKTSNNILDYIKQNGQVTANEMVEHLGISRQALFKHHLSKMIDDNTLVKIGRPPKVFYSLSTLKETVDVNSILIKETQRIINDNYFIITPSGDKKEGVDGFVYWCEKNSLPLEKTAKEYLLTIAKYKKYKKDGLIDGYSKLKKSLVSVNLDSIYYLDFYSIERFGKTKLGQMLLYAKQSQNTVLMKSIVLEIKPSIDKIIKKFKIDGLGFIPPTVKRETQLMKFIEKRLNEDVRKLKISKIKTVVAVPQKTLSKLSDRIENAKNTIVVEENSKFNNILLVDDAVGSGATLNETAKKIRDKNICKGKIIGVALTGSFNGFDVISEV